MLFRHAESVTIELGQCTRADFDSATRCLEIPIERPTRRIDGGCISKRCLKLLADLSQKSRLLLEEILNRHSSLLLVALSAGNGEVRNSVGTSSCLGYDVLDVEHNPALATIDALAVKLFEEIFLEFVACKLALLVFHAGDCRVLHQLRIELHKLLNKTRDRDKPCQAVHPRHDGVDTMLK